MSVWREEQYCVAGRAILIVRSNNAVDADMVVVDHSLMTMMFNDGDEYTMSVGRLNLRALRSLKHSLVESFIKRTRRSAGHPCSAA